MDLNTILIILGVLALIALVAHGLWSNRREKTRYFNNENNPFNRGQPHSAGQPLEQGAPNLTRTATPSFSEPAVSPQQTHTAPSQTVIEPEKHLSDIRITLPGQQVETTLMADPIEKERPIEPINEQPIFNDESAPVPQAEPEQNEQFILLYVVAPEHRHFQGITLAQELDNLSFILGADHLYHRHLDCTQTSPVVFSVADINQPGTFNPYGLHELFTQGIAIFMRLPSAGNDKANLKLMITAAKSLAEQLDGFVLTEQQAIFDAQAEMDYLAKV